MPESSRPAPCAGRLAALDGRWKILLMLAVSLAAQRLPVLPGFFLVAAQALALFSPGLREVGTMLRAGAVYIAFWLAMTTGSDLLAGKGLFEAGAGALPLCVRLSSLTLTGILYVGLSSPMETGRAAAWFLQPLLGKRAWKLALSVALVAWFLPLSLRQAGKVLAGMRARGLVLPFRKKALLLAGTSLVMLERNASDLAVGLASRRLDDWRSWQ